jgi:hypothetical protein
MVPSLPVLSPISMATGEQDLATCLPVVSPPHNLAPHAPEPPAVMPGELSSTGEVPLESGPRDVALFNVWLDKTCRGL